MRGDFSRTTFRTENHYSGVLMQQGRVQVDADFNEQQAITRHRAETAAADVIGPSGTPKGAPGFGITIAAGGADLSIGKGRYYVDGILCENDEDRRFSEQRDLRPTTQPSLLPTADGLYMAYLEAFERHVTALEDPAIKEVALGGPDTATRTKTVWQVRLLGVTDPGGAVDCTTAFPEWGEVVAGHQLDGAGAGRMRARSMPSEQTPDPLCVLPPQAGYRRLENQLYRVEVHRGGDRATARFKWSRDNGTVASRIEPDENGIVVSGSSIGVAQIGKDDLLTFASDPLPEWLELTDDRYELADHRGALARVQSVDPATRTITFSGTLPALDAASHPLVRRWDQRGTGADADGVAMTGDWQGLEDGVEVRFGDGEYRTGDYWLIPARTAMGLELGAIEWPLDGTDPAARPPEGVRRRVTPLALVRRTGGALALVSGGDCRALFPPLTDIDASDVGYSDDRCGLGADNVQEALDVLCARSTSLCTLLVGPGENLHEAFGSLGDRQDALICLRAGTYTLDGPLEVAGRRHIVVTGAGAGTRVIAPDDESGLVFRDCASVKVTNLHAETGVVRVGKGAPGLTGPLTFVDCGSVTVEGTSLRCPGGPRRAGTCLTVRNAPEKRAAMVRVTGNELEVGHLQTGILIVNADRSSVTGNVLRPGPRPSDRWLLRFPEYRALLRRHILSDFRIGQAEEEDPPAGTNATVRLNDLVVHFRTAGNLRRSREDNEWQRLLEARAPQGITSTKALRLFLIRQADRLFREGDELVATRPIFRDLLANLLKEDRAAADQGVVVAGEVASAVTITGNTIRSAIQGVHVGLSRRGNITPSAGVVTIADNDIQVCLPATAAHDRHGIFVGSVDSLVIERNHLELLRVPRTAGLSVEGMRVFGTMGNRVIVRHNHCRPRYDVGVTFAPLNPSLPAQPLWIITENELEAASTKVAIPGRATGQVGVKFPNAVRARVRGIEANFA